MLDLEFRHVITRLVGSKVTVISVELPVVTVPLTGASESHGTFETPPVAKAKLSTSAPPGKAPTSVLAPVIMSMMRSSPVIV